MATTKKNNANKPPAKKTASQKPKTTQIIKVIDDLLIETGKHYLLLGQANQLLVSEEIITIKERSNKLLKQLLEANKIPHAYQTESEPKQWRIPLSEKGKQRKEAVERKTVDAKKTTSPTTITKQEKVEVTQTSPLKVFLYVVAVCFWFGACNELTKTNTTEFSGGFFLFTLVVGIIIFFKAKSIKPITKTISNYSPSYTRQDYVNYNENTRNTYIPIIINRTAKTNKSNTKQRRQLNEDEIYGMAYDFAGDGIEDEVRDYLDFGRNSHDSYDNDYHSDDRQEYDEGERDDW